jgi:hypothetical protein
MTQPLRSYLASRWSGSNRPKLQQQCFPYVNLASNRKVVSKVLVGQFKPVFLLLSY